MTTATTPGAGDRLSAAKAHAAKQAEARLAPKLEKANTASYLRAMQGHARSFGQKPPKAITDKNVLAAIAARAGVSAQSIVATQQDRMQALIAEKGSIAAAQAPFRAWEKSQVALLSGYESSLTTHAAQDDLVSRNGLTGTERCSPTETAGLDDECDDAVAMGDVPIGDLPDLPSHARCPHFAIQSYDTPDDPSALWFGT